MKKKKLRSTLKKDNTNFLKTQKAYENKKKGNRINDFLKKHHFIFFTLKHYKAMKKNKPFGESFFRSLKKILLTMRIAVILMILGILQARANDAYSQNTRLSLNFSDAALVNVLDKIEAESEFFFLFNEKLLDTERKVSITANDQLIGKILDDLFAGTDVKYSIIDRKIILAPEYLNKEKDATTIMQQQTVTGTVTDSQTGDAMPGVNVIVKGTTLGTITGADGKYSVTIPDKNIALVISFIGYADQEVFVTGKSVIDVALVSEALSLEEVVVVGYGTRQLRDVTGSISTASGTELKDIRATNISEVLKGTLSGVTALQAHTPEGGAIIRVRGYGTINNNDPLWVVDGVPGSAEVIPNNIASITVLKDAAAQAIYGARGANGVILVTTKSGKRNQKAQINVQVKRGVGYTTKFYDMLNTPEYAEMLWLSAKNSGMSNYSHPIFGAGAEPDIPEYIIPTRGQNVDLSLYDDMMIHEDGDDTYFITKTNQKGTDWQDVITRDHSNYTEYNVDITGGSETSEYSFMANYLNQEGNLKYTSFKRYNMSPNITFIPNKWLKIGEKTGITYSESWGNASGIGSSGGALYEATRMHTWIPVYDVGDNFAGSICEAGGNVRNPMFTQYMNQYDVSKRLIVSGNAFAEVTVIPGLSFRTLFGYNYGTQDNRNLEYNEKATAERGMYDSVSESDDFSLQLNWTNTAEFIRTFGGIHDLTILVGTESINNTRRWRSAGSSEFFSRNPDYMQIDVGARSQTASGNMSDWKLFSIFTRVNYDLVDKYLLSATFRRDGSSRFGKENRFGNFPAVSAGWIISEESFMATAKSWIDQLKIRVGWGQSGNDQIGNYNGFTTYDSRIASGFNNSYYPLTGINVGTPTAGFQSATFGNPNVRWEITTTTDLGFDAMFKKINISVDLWKRKTDDMLFPKQIPLVNGVATVPSVNVGSMDNKGIDVTFSYNGDALNNDLNYGVSLNFSHYQNKITKLSGAEGEFLQGGISYATVGRAEMGTSFPEFYGYIVEGIFQTDEEAAAHPPAFGATGTYNQPGHWKYKDVNNDGVINTEDRTYIGSPHPKFTAGLNLHLNYKELSLSTRFYSSYGNKLFNAVRNSLDFNRDNANRSKRRLYESWGSPYLKSNLDAKMPKAEFSDANNMEWSDYYVEDASYLRMENLRISYNLVKLIKLGAFRDLQFYGQISNVFTLTKYTGLDPEVAGSGISYGIDHGSWPMQRQFMLGLSLGL